METSQTEASRTHVGEKAGASAVPPDSAPTSNVLQRIADSPVFQYTVLTLIIVNAVILGLETLPAVKADYGPILKAVDHVIIYAFVAELFIRFLAEPRTYFRSGWNVFDFVVVAVSLSAAESGLAAFRALRVLRVLRVITVMPRMRVVVAALLDAIPGIASVGIVLVLILYVFAVIAANLYGPQHPDLFGDVFVSMYTLFTIMTLEGWREIADAVAETHPRSWIFFLTFVLIATFTMLNLFVAIVVRVVEEDSEELAAAQTEEIRSEIRALREDIAALAAQKRD